MFCYKLTMIAAIMSSDKMMTLHYTGTAAGRCMSEHRKLEPLVATECFYLTVGERVS